MNQVAGNAILKELEEPNDHVAIILIVNSLEKMIATIISRCQRIEMKRASVREVIARVKFLKPDWPDAKVDEAVMFCDGKIGDALDYEGIKEKTKYVRDIVKVISNKNDDIQGIFSKVAELETMKKAKKEDKDENTRGFLLDILRILAYIYKDILLAKLSIKDVMLTKYGLNPSEIRDYSEKKLVNILKFVESAQRDLLSNANTSLLFTDLFFNIRKEGLSND
jgi:DNA polymerase III delta prime subunit